MSYRSEMKKVLEKYYPEHKVDTIYAPTLEIVGIHETKYLKITVKLKNNKNKTKI